MKAFLLAAGYGTRLRPLTDSIPKCMVPICGRPLLCWWMDLFEKHSITEVLINTHYLPDAVRKFIEVYNKQNTGTKLIEFYEEKLLGSGGTILVNRSFIENEENFFVCYADNLTNTDLSKMLEFHKKKQSLLTMGLFHTNKPKECGIAAINDQQLIYNFVEKPINPKNDLANAGIYVTDKTIFDYFPQNNFIDFGKDILPNLVNKMYGYEIKDYLLDIGNLDNYQKAEEEWHQ
ncbi:nucleotidyltransferase family protein [uncultured Phascolarctobacterium sp.]|jgi:mannose-1-phosphate guanylyltransferase|uniref:nucleotidyltransferase family protein n=1 Tax=uncultured Phascolarctobacterium sp. TaxID=512296 RepID=UPI00261AC4EB|nr:nucleotidyltransferase family protein [uncultured Phascolarctobacterium sp.]